MVRDGFASQHPTTSFIDVHLLRAASRLQLGLRQAQPERADPAHPKLVEGYWRVCI